MAEFTGERIIPGQVDEDLLNEHLARYAFAARLARNKRVLDAGCGAGYGSAELAKGALAVTGADVAAEAVAYARENYRLPNLHFEQASAAALPHPDASFDLVVAFEVIEHLENWATFLTEVRRVLVPTGQFIVSTPNRLYYAETRERTGPNPFHVHEFDYAEFRSELTTVFPHISLFLENHVEGVVFQPVERGEPAEVRVDAGEAAPAGSHFFVAVCAHRPQTGTPTFVYVPRAANVLRERERHIDLLEGELRTKDEWLEKAKRELEELNVRYQELLGQFRAQKEELERSNRWALALTQEIEAARVHIEEMEAAGRALAEGYEGKIAELERENRAKTEWAQETERRLGAEIAAAIAELSKCVELLHQTEATVEERTAWALRLEAEAGELTRRLNLYRASRWVRLGRRLSLGPGATEG